MKLSALIQLLSSIELESGDLPVFLTGETGWYGARKIVVDDCSSVGMSQEMGIPVGANFVGIE